MAGKPKHGHARVWLGSRYGPSPTYKSWEQMWARCRNAKHHAYAMYGGRGIEVCARWLVFENFLADMGERPPGTTLDRVNNAGNYDPANCKWSTYTEQARNTRKYRLTDAFVTAVVALIEDGMSQTAAGRLLNVSQATVGRALKKARSDNGN